MQNWLDTVFQVSNLAGCVGYSVRVSGRVLVMASLWLGLHSYGYAHGYGFNSTTYPNP